MSGYVGSSGAARVLAATGAGVTVGGVYFSEFWFVACAAALTLTGAVLIRVCFRRGTGVGSR